MKGKTLIAYFTKGGASEQYAAKIAETLEAEGLEVKTYNLAVEIPIIASYDVVILGTGIRMFRVYRKWKKILKQKELKDKTLFLFLSSGMAIEEPEKAVEKFLLPIINKYDLTPKSMISFPGIIPEKWAKLDEQKDTMNLEMAANWAKDIAGKIR